MSMIVDLDDLILHAENNGDDKEHKENFLKIYASGKYEKVSELSALNFIEQLRIRADIMEMLNIGSPCLHHYLPNWLAVYLSDDIYISEPEELLVDVSAMLSPEAKVEMVEREFSYSSDDHGEVLSSLNSITPIHVRNIIAMAEVAKSYGFNGNDSYSYRMPKMPFATLLAERYKESMPKLVAVNINIESFSDKEILDDMASLLKKWRSELSVNEEKDCKGISSNALRKAVNNKYLPLLDAMIAHKLFNGAISDLVILDTLYPSLDIELDALRKTYKHQAMRFSDERHVSAWKRTLVKSGVEHLTIKDALTKKF